MSAHLDGEASPAGALPPHGGGGGGGRRRRMAGSPTLPLLATTASELLSLDTHPDGTRTTPHSRSWQGEQGGRYSAMSNNNAPPYDTHPRGAAAQGGGSPTGGWPPNNPKNLLHQQSGGGGGGVRRSLGPRAFSKSGGGSATSGSPATSLNLIRSVTGEAIQFSETNMDWTKLNIFRTRLCDRLTQVQCCHMANRCLFSHDLAWPRRTPFLPRATALTLRYIPVWCPRVPWPSLNAACDSRGKISWSSGSLPDGTPYDPNYAHNCCIRGDNCPFVHNLEEFLYHPEVYKTRMCCLANDDNVGDENGNCLCPWYFCPFAHYLYELRDVRQTKAAWHPPPQIVDNHYVARTQGFDDVELTIIQYVRKSPNGSINLYLRHSEGGADGPSSNSIIRSPHTMTGSCSASQAVSTAASASASSVSSGIRDLLFGRYLLPPVFRPIIGSSLERLIASDWHRKIEFDDLLYLLVIASLLNLVLYPVENFYVPALLSLQNTALEYQLDLGGGPAACRCGGSGACGACHSPPRETKDLLALYDKIAFNNWYGASSGGGGVGSADQQQQQQHQQQQQQHNTDDSTTIPPSTPNSNPQDNAPSPAHSTLSKTTQRSHRSSSPLLTIDPHSAAGGAAGSPPSPSTTLPAPFAFLPPASNSTTSPTSSSWRGSECASPAAGGGAPSLPPLGGAHNSLPRFFNSSGRYEWSPGSSTKESSSSCPPAVPAKLTNDRELESFLESLCSEDLMRVVEMFANSGEKESSDAAAETFVME